MISNQITGNFKVLIDLLVLIGNLFMIKSSEDLKSKYKPGSDYYLGNTLSRLKAKKRNFHNEEHSARYARFRFLVAKISLLSL